MSQAVTCPVCGGTGQLPFPDDVIQPKVCHGCDGKGWVEIGDSVPIRPIQPPRPTTYYVGDRICVDSYDTPFGTILIRRLKH